VATAAGARPGAPGLVAALEVHRDGHDVALPVDRRYLRLHDGDRDLRVRLHAGSAAARYRFRLLGVDAGWVETGWPAEHRVAALPAGPLTLQVAVADASGWGPVEERVLLVDSPWWQTRAVLVAGSASMLALSAWAVLAARARRRRRLAWAIAQARRELAERHSEAKTRFLATLGHELRTPLTGVLGMAELLHDGALDPRQRGQVEAIQGAGRHLLRLVNDALDLARIEAGRLPLQPAPFAVRPLLDEVAGLLRPLAEAKSLGLMLACAPDLPPALLGDATRVRQILFNLGHNAIKFCDRGAVVVEAAGLAPTGVRLLVRDDGPGLAADRQARLFHRFEPGDGRHGDAGGAGLGLAICRELAVAMGGTIDVQSVPGQGACFRVELPLPAAAPPPIAATVPAPPGAARRVLLVEDDPLVAEVVAGLLRRDGHRVVHVPHGLAALAELEVAAFDVAVLDLDLPGIDGLRLAALIRARSPLPLLALTARADPGAEPAARAAGMAAFLRKPVSGAALAAAIDSVLDGGDAAPA
jgi:signal transduction histidine kinase/CheY-like chemotaxis protein